MIFTNVSNLPAAWTMGFRKDGREMLIVIVKATYLMPESEENPALAPVQSPLVEADRFAGEPGLSAPLHESDFAHDKQGCDVLLVGSAYAPQGRPVTRCGVGLKVGGMLKKFAVTGDRYWKKNALGSVSASGPEPFHTMSITYDCAFGGVDRTKEADGMTYTYLANPVGRGYWRYEDNIDRQPLPNTEELNRPVESFDSDYVPQALSPVGRNWGPRSRFAGTYNQQWLEYTAPLWPNDFDERYFQAAPPDQIIPYPSGGEEIVMVNLTQDGYRRFFMPSKVMPVTFIPYRGRDVTQWGNLDTIMLEPDVGRFSLTWRCQLPLEKSVFDIKETIVGEMTRAWHRSRRFPGKKYYSSLEEAARDKMQRA